MTTATAPSKALTIVDRVEQSPVVRMLDDRASALMELLPDQAAADRFRRVSVQAIVKNPDLLECTPESVILAIFEAAAQGLEPTGASGGAHLVPYNVNVGTKSQPRYEKRAQLIPDYRGVINLITKPDPKTGKPSEVVSVEVAVVKEGDEFSYQKGTDGFIRHVPSLAADRSAKATTHAYVVFQLRSGRPIFDVEDRAGIERVRAKGRHGGFSPWDSDWDEMAKKTMIKRGSKVVPVRPEVRSILLREDEMPTAVAEAETDEVAGPTRTDRLGARLRNVTPPELTPVHAKPATDAHGDADLVDAVFSAIEDDAAAGEPDGGLVGAIREAAERSALGGGITAAQKAALKPVIELVGKDAFRVVTQAAFGPEALASPTAAIGEAILTVADSFESEAALVAAWQGAAA